MSENKIQILLETIDKMTPEFKKANAEAIKEIQKLEKESKKSSNSMQDGLKQSAKQMREFRTAILPIVAILGTVIATTKEWSKSNKETRDAFNDLSNSTRTLSASIGSLLAPSIVGLSKAVKESTEFLVGFFDDMKEGYTKFFEAITFGTQYTVAFFTALNAGQGITESSAIAMDVAARAAEEMTAEFRASMEGVIIQNQYVAQSHQNLTTLIDQLSDEQVNISRAQIDEQITLLKFYETTFKTAHQGMAAFTVTVGKAIQTNLSTAITNTITQAQSAKEAFSQLGQAMVQAIVGFMVQKVVASVLEKTLLAGTVAASTVAAGVVAAAWAPAAALVSLATFGANAAPAAAGIATVSALTAGLSLVGKAADGMAPASAWKDAIGFGGAQADGGDYLVTKPTMFIAGESGAERATFTPIGKSSGGSFGDINIFIQGGINPGGSSIDEMAEQLGFAFEREVRTARG